MMSWVKLPTTAIMGEAVRGLVLLDDRRRPVLVSKAIVTLDHGLYVSDAVGRQLEPIRPISQLEESDNLL